MEAMDKSKLKRLIDTAAGRIHADLVVKNCKIIDVYNGRVIEGDIALCEDLIAGFGRYDGARELDAGGLYAAPGFIDGHVHIESACVSPEELGRLIVPRGTTTIIADAHEIANVCGLAGLRYMIGAGGATALDIKWMLPSCVPATPFEHAGAVIDAQAMKEPLESGDFLGLGEFMNFPGVVAGDDAVLDKLMAAKECGKPVDGHSPGIAGKDLNAYAAAGIGTDHECSAVREMLDRVSRGMYVLLRQGSACHNLRELLKGVTPVNSRRCLLCTADLQAKTILELGHLDNHLRICVEEGIDPFTAIQMATLNAAQCYGLHDRGAIAPGRRADLGLFDSLTYFIVKKGIVGGELAAADGGYLLPVIRADASPTRGSFHVGDFSAERLRLTVHSQRAHVIRIVPGGVVTADEILEIGRNERQEFVFDPKRDIVKLAVIERHQNTGNVAVALLAGYGLGRGAVAVSVAHDSHNIITAGADDRDMAFAVEQLIAQDGGIVLVKDGQVLGHMPMPIGGLMSDRSGEWVREKLTELYEIAHEELGVSRDVEPVMTLCFMALPVIPALKLTDMGLFDVTQFKHIPIEA
jgi:adenine deaminase